MLTLWMEAHSVLCSFILFRKHVTVSFILGVERESECSMSP